MILQIVLTTINTKERKGSPRDTTFHRLVYYEEFHDVRKAIAREKEIKGWRREKKLALIEKVYPKWRDLGKEEED